MMPGYTHMQVAMPSSFGMWFAAYGESLADDLILLKAAHEICDKNPLGSAAGYGSSFPLVIWAYMELTFNPLKPISLVVNSRSRGKEDP